MVAGAGRRRLVFATGGGGWCPEKCRLLMGGNEVVDIVDIPNLVMTDIHSSPWFVDGPNRFLDGLPFLKKVDLSMANC